MEGHNLSGLIELLLVVGLLVWFGYSQVIQPGKRRRDEQEKAAESQDQPPRVD